MLERINLGRLIEETVELITKHEKETTRPESEEILKQQTKTEETSQTSQE